MDKITKKKVHCLGGALVDLIVKPIKQYPQPKSNTSVFVDSFLYSVGGGAVNSSLALSKLVGNIALYSKIGDDIHGQMITNCLKNAGVNVENLLISKSAHTSTVIVGVHEDADRSFISYHGALSEYTKDDFSIDTLLDCDFLLCSDLFNLPEIDGQPLAHILELAQRKKIITLLDATWGILGLRKDILEQVLPFVDYFLPSANDCRLMYPDKSDEELLDYFHKKGAKKVLLKRGADGVLAYDGRSKHAYPALKNSHEVHDTTGAGDTFNAGFLYGLIKEFVFDDCIKLGSVFAGYSLMGSGDWYTAEQIQQELKDIFGESI